MGLGTILIRADASPEIGTGHAMRCLALAQAWSDQGGRAVFAMVESTSAIRERIAAEHFEVVEIAAAAGSSQDSESLRRYAEEQHASWIVLDGYRFDAEYHQGVREGPSKVLSIDDDGRCSEFGSDLILNQNVTASPAMYAGRAESRLLLGPRYALLRREFVVLRGHNRTIPPSAKSALVTLGGNTQVDVAQAVLAALAKTELPEMTVTFVVGGSSPFLNFVQPTTGCPRVTFARNPPNMAELMASADIAISASGSTCWELCFLGVPSLLIDVAPNQRPIARALDAGGYAIHAGAGGHVSEKKLSDQFRELAMSQELRGHLSERCLGLVDGRGARRVVSALRAEQLLFRRAVSSDAEILWIWSNEPDVRKASLSSNPIGWGEHQAWFRARFADPGSLILIAEEAGEPIGTVRLQAEEAAGARISLTVAPGARGLGLAARLIEEGMERAASVFGVGEVEALVKPWNHASRRSFENAGFRVASSPDSSGPSFIRYVRETLQAPAGNSVATAARRRA